MRDGHDPRCECMRCMESYGIFEGVEPGGMYILVSRRVGRTPNGRRPELRLTAAGSMSAVFRLAKLSASDHVKQEIRRADWSRVGVPTRPARLPG